MSKRALLLPCAATLAALVSGHALACGHAHESYPKGATLCLSHHVLECQDFGAWHKLPGRCEADGPLSAKGATDPANKAPATEQSDKPSAAAQGNAPPPQPAPNPK